GEVLRAAEAFGQGAVGAVEFVHERVGRELAEPRMRHRVRADLVSERTELLDAVPVEERRGWHREALATEASDGCAVFLADHAADDEEASRDALVREDAAGAQAGCEAVVEADREIRLVDAAGAEALDALAVGQVVVIATEVLDQVAERALLVGEHVMEEEVLQ